MKETTTIISTNHPTLVMDRVYWTLRATNPKSRIELQLNAVHAEPDGDNMRIICTDGRRLHTATIPTDIIPAGTWTIVEAKKTIVLEKLDQRYLNWQRVVPQAQIHHGTYFALPWKKTDATKLSSNIAELIQTTKRVFNLQYLFDLACDFKYDISSADDDPTKATIFTTFDRYAVIMPINPKGAKK